MSFEINGVPAFSNSYISSSDLKVAESIYVTKSEAIEETGFEVGTVNSITTDEASFKTSQFTSGARLLFLSFQGSVSGYASGGDFIPTSTVVDTIDKFPFATDTNATDVGVLTVAKERASGQSSAVSGYTSGGLPYTNVIDKFPFATDSDATEVGVLSAVTASSAGQSSLTHGYSAGGDRVPATTNIISKFPFSSDSDATDVAFLSQARVSPAGQSSSTHGYNSGGLIFIPPSGTRVNTIDKFPFATDTNATDVGDLTAGKFRQAGQSSTVSGYITGRSTFADIEKFPFAADTNSSEVGDLTDIGRENGAGQSSESHGYTSGGDGRNIIDKFPFSTDTDATDVGDLPQALMDVSGQQV